MLGLILDYYWYNTTQNPVQITVGGTLYSLRNVKSVDPLQAVDQWSRADVVPLEEHDVSSQLGGGTLKAHICALKDTDFMEDLRSAEREA